MAVLQQASRPVKCWGHIWQMQVTWLENAVKFRQFVQYVELYLFLLTWGMVEVNLLNITYFPSYTVITLIKNDEMYDTSSSGKSWIATNNICDWWYTDRWSRHRGVWCAKSSYTWLGFKVLSFILTSYKRHHIGKATREDHSLWAHHTVRLPYWPGWFPLGRCVIRGSPLQCLMPNLEHWNSYLCRVLMTE